MLQYEKDPPEQELYSLTTELARADDALVDALVVAPQESDASHEATLASTMVARVRTLATYRIATMGAGYDMDALPGGGPDELLLSSSFLAKITHNVARHDARGASSPSSNTVVGIVAVAYSNLPTHCAAEPEMLRQIKLAAYLHAAHEDAMDGAAASQLTAENLLRSYEYSETDLVMRAVLALSHAQEAKSGSVKEAVESGGVPLAAVLAAKTHYDVAINPDTIDGSEGMEELAYKRAQRDDKLEIIRELLHESEGFDSSAARWLMHRIFSTSSVKLNQYLRRFGSNPMMSSENY